MVFKSRHHVDPGPTLSSLNGLTGDVNLTSPDDSISIIVSGQDIQLETLGAPPSGIAGGDLSGYYPNPSVIKLNGTPVGPTSAANTSILLGDGTKIYSVIVSGDVKIETGGVTVIGDGKVTNAMLFGAIDPGKLTLASANLIVGNASNVGAAVSMSGDAALSNVGALTLATVNGNIGIFGDSTHVSQVTVNAKGLITAISSVPIALTPGVIALTSAHILVGNVSNIAADVALSGDATLTNSGVLTIANSAITNAKMANMANLTIKGNISGSAAAPSDLAISSLAEATSNILTITNGTNAIIGASNLTIQVKQSSTSQSGYLSSTDWTTFNSKLTATLASANIWVGNASNVATATSMTGDVTITNTGVSAIGNGKVTNAMLAGSITASKLVGTDIATVGTITLGTWHGSVIAEIYGGTNQSTYTLGDTLYSSAANTLSKLAGNTTSTKKFLRQTGTGTVSAAPAWDTVTGADIPGAALTKTDDTNVTLTLGGSPTTALLNAASLTLGWSGTLATTRGGIGLDSSAWAQGDIPYISATGTWNHLAKDSNATRYLSNTGTSNNPAWAQINLANGVSGLLPIANGGNNIASQTTNGILYNDGTHNTTSANLTYASGNLTIAGAVISTPSQMVYVSSLNGSDSTGNGGATAPYATIAHALTSITTASATNPFCIFTDGSPFSESGMVLKPNVTIDFNQSIVTLSGNITLDAAFLTTASNSALKNVIWAIGANSFLFTLTTKSAVQTVFLCENMSCVVGQSFVITGVSHAGTSDHNTLLIVRNCFWDVGGISPISTRSITTTNCDVRINNCYFDTGSITNSSSTASGNSGCTIMGGYFNTSLTLKASGSRTLTTAISGMATMPATWTIDGANSIVQMYVPYDTAPTLINSATFSPTSNFSGIISTSNTTVSTSVGTGAIVSGGGLGVAGRAHIGGVLNVTDSTGSTSISTGSGVFGGGVGIGKDLWVGGVINPNMSIGSVLFIGTSGIAQSNVQFFWDNTNHRLGIGTASPGDLLHIVGAGTAIKVSDSTTSGRFFASSGSGGVYMGSSSSSNLILRTNDTDRMTFDVNGNAGLGGTGFNGGTNVLLIANGTAPGTPTGGYDLYTLSGALKGKGTSGTTTNIGNAEPHCKKCGSDFGWGWENPLYGGQVIICKICEIEYSENLRKCINYIVSNDENSLNKMKEFLTTEVSHIIWNPDRNDEYKNIKIPENIGKLMADNVTMKSLN